MRSLMSPQRTAPRRLPMVRASPFPFFHPCVCAIILCANVDGWATEALVETGPNETPGGVVIESSKVEAVTIQAS